MREKEHSKDKRQNDAQNASVGPWVEKSLTAEQFNVLRKKGTEAPFTGKLLHNKNTGAYLCAGCGAEVFSSGKKFDSGTGWPSFSDAVKKNVETRKDTSHGMQRIEVICKRCGGHLGHIFDDGPKPSGMRYCINSCALHFKKNKEKKKFT